MASTRLLRQPLGPGLAAKLRTCPFLRTVRMRGSGAPAAAAMQCSARVRTCCCSWGSARTSTSSRTASAVS
eukprot:10341551-Lingulodinium_polyedra.AAC.1